jgi:hypothetical protein
MERHDENYQSLWEAADRMEVVMTLVDKIIDQTKGSRDTDLGGSVYEHAEAIRKVLMGKYGR